MSHDSPLREKNRKAQCALHPDGWASPAPPSSCSHLECPPPQSLSQPRSGPDLVLGPLPRSPLRFSGPPPRTSPTPEGPFALPQEDVRLALVGAQAEKPAPRLRKRALLVFPGRLHRTHIYETRKPR